MTKPKVKSKNKSESQNKEDKIRQEFIRDFSERLDNLRKSSSERSKLFYYLGFLRAHFHWNIANFILCMIDVIILIFIMVAKLSLHPIVVLTFTFICLVSLLIEQISYIYFKKIVIGDEEWKKKVGTFYYFYLG